MKIGIDIDNVISSFDNALLKEYMKHDKTLRNSGIVDEMAKDIRQGMFDWSSEEESRFYNENIERIVSNLKPIRNAKETIDKLKLDGNEIYIISGRDNGEYSNLMKMTKEWLSKYQIKYDKLILVNAYEKCAKKEVCIKNNIDVMIDASIKVCSELKDTSTKALLMNTRYNKHDNELERVLSWNDIYEKITLLNTKTDTSKINVIIDTDLDNECDDKFALSYLLMSQNRFNVEAITIAPYQHDNEFLIEEGQEKSYKDAMKICNFLNFDYSNKLFKGACDYLDNEGNVENEAVNKIIEVALKNEKTYIIAIGAITNIAMAIIKEPKIIDKLEIVWLGGHSILSKKNDEYNFEQDVLAVKKVFESKVHLTIIPCKNVASNLVTSIFELEYYLKGKSKLCDYLCSEFYDDGKHGKQTRRVIWDISAVAYLINKDWFEVSYINCPNINEDTSYSLNTSNHKIAVVDYLNTEMIYKDLFSKLKNT